MVRFLIDGRRAQPYFAGETDFHSPQSIPFSLSQVISSFQIAEHVPSLVATSLSVGAVILPIKAFGRSILTFFLDSEWSLLRPGPTSVTVIVKPWSRTLQPQLFESNLPKIFAKFADHFQLPVHT